MLNQRTGVTEKQPNFNRGTFSLINVIETVSYFTCKYKQ